MYLADNVKVTCEREKHLQCINIVINSRQVGHLGSNH
uniref:Uncharacterized protein n=1 Tax=Arundo donax TaxID=35708 RepID=A0A0A8YHR7_ARUDO